MAVHVRATEKVISINEDEELRNRGFDLGSTLGEGSYAKVKAAFWTKIKRRVAIKIINKKKAPKDFQTRFLPRELEIMRQIQHPNIVMLHEIMHFNGKVYLILEMAGHGDLLEYVKLRGAIPEPRAKVMYHQICLAISYLHTKNIVHRDLKCENILLDTNNSVKVSDFGFARKVTDGELSKTFCGSAAYAAPEILQGVPYNGPAYDVWSMGVILYIMVCGSMPYDDSNIKKMIRYQTERKVGFSKSRQISPEAKHLIHRILEANVEARYTVKQVMNSRWLGSTGEHHSTSTTRIPTVATMSVDSPTSPGRSAMSHGTRRTSLQGRALATDEGGTSNDAHEERAATSHGTRNPPTHSHRDHTHRAGETSMQVEQMVLDGDDQVEVGRHTPHAAVPPPLMSDAAQDRDALVCKAEVSGPSSRAAPLHNRTSNGAESHNIQGNTHHQQHHHHHAHQHALKHNHTHLTSGQSPQDGHPHQQPNERNGATKYIASTPPRGHHFTQYIQASARAPQETNQETRTHEAQDYLPGSAME